MEKKVTKREKFEMLKALVVDNEMLVEFIDHEIELLDNKKSQGKTKDIVKQETENDLVYTALVNSGRPVTASELIAENDLSALKNESGIVSTQKISAVVKRLVALGKAETYTDKKKTLIIAK